MRTVRRLQHARSLRLKHRRSVRNYLVVAVLARRRVRHRLQNDALRNLEALASTLEYVLLAQLHAEVKAFAQLLRLVDVALVSHAHRRPASAASSEAVRGRGPQSLVASGRGHARPAHEHGLAGRLDGRLAAAELRGPGGLADEGVTWRLAEAVKARERALRSARDDETEVVVADNGVKLDADELRISREKFASIDFSRGGRSRN